MNIKCAELEKITSVVHYNLPNHTRFISAFPIKNGSHHNTTEQTPSHTSGCSVRKFITIQGTWTFITVFVTVHRGINIWKLRKMGRKFDSLNLKWEQVNGTKIHRIIKKKIWFYDWRLCAVLTTLNLRPTSKWQSRQLGALLITCKHSPGQL